ncbi:helix-turn-helix transcriptional regulator [Aquincola tertiaricarbonis]|uniref:helix-turn-helix transcriptional regulator n=1 Tax=Aquincola tertiaricarbonis TaxID=391953 RepID=UPI001E4BF694|nr:hypothetical protein [Aquincola tertiaricarbonis]
MTADPTHLLSLDELAKQVYAVSKRQLQRICAEDPGFPRPIRLGARTFRYVRSEHEAYVRTLQRIAPAEPHMLRCARVALEQLDRGTRSSQQHEGESFTTKSAQARAVYRHR